MFALVSADLLRTLMERTGTGQPISIRQLADSVGVPHGTIGNLLTGEQKSVPQDVAYSICERIGVDLLILFAPLGRQRSVAAPVIAAVPA
ncbi:helix-turn-helix transcriptional regulator [Streptomyces sp. NPDC046977]|uniref:helix-turn-helix domain-containing protein n=1 Tax=Streptomyces sp. NPDC046977 TaxID=3154703 RepID=UPI0033D88126